MGQPGKKRGPYKKRAKTPGSVTSKTSKASKASKTTATSKVGKASEAQAQQPQPQQKKTKKVTKAKPKRARRASAKRVLNALDGVDNSLRAKLETRLERLESTNATDALEGERAEGIAEGESDDDVDYEYHSDNSVGPGTTAKKKRKRRARKAAPVAQTPAPNSRGGGASTTATPSGNPVGCAGTDAGGAGSSRWKRQTLVSMLLSDHAVGLLGGDSIDEGKPDFVTCIALPSRLPARRICAVTGFIGKYVDVGTGLAVADAAAMETLQEHPPPWLRASVSSHASPYHDAVRAIQDEREEKLRLADIELHAADEVVDGGDASDNNDDNDESDSDSD